MANHVLDRTNNWVTILPAKYIPGKRYPTANFHHGIGESRNFKTLDEMSVFHNFLDKWADGLGGEEVIFILAQDMDGKVETTEHVKAAWKYADQFTDGRKMLGGLSMGAGETMEQWMSALYVNYPDCTFIIPICFPSWESLDETHLSKSNIAFWSFMGVLDKSVTIASWVNTIGDIIAAGRKENTNFYVSIYPNRDHYIWTSVMGSIIPVSPDPKALDANGKSIYGLAKYPGIPDWAIVNNPAVNPIQYFLMQKPGAPKPLPRLGQVVTPPPVSKPAPAPTGQTVYFKAFYQDQSVWEITYSDGKSKDYFKMPVNDSLLLQYIGFNAAGRQYFVIQTVGGIKKVFDTKKV